MSHQVLSNEQFAAVPDLPEEKSIDNTTPMHDEIPEQEDDDIGAEGNRGTNET